MILEACTLAGRQEYEGGVRHYIVHTMVINLEPHDLRQLPLSSMTLQKGVVRRWEPGLLSEEMSRSRADVGPRLHVVGIVHAYAHTKDPHAT